MGKAVKNRVEGRRPNLSRRQLAVTGVAGTAVVLAGGALFFANASTHDRPGEATRAVEASAAGPNRSASAVTVAAGEAPGSSTPFVSLPPLKVATALPEDPQERLANARRLGANDIKPQRPLIRAETQGADVRVTEKGSVRDDGWMLRTVSAHADLTGYSELAWVADEGAPFGDARCSQNFRLSNEQAGKIRPTLMICWRVSAERSVYTVAVDTRHHPSKQTSVAAIDRTWKALGR